MKKRINQDELNNLPQKKLNKKRSKTEKMDINQLENTKKLKKNEDYLNKLPLFEPSSFITETNKLDMKIIPNFLDHNKVNEPYYHHLNENPYKNDIFYIDLNSPCNGWDRNKIDFTTADDSQSKPLAIENKRAIDGICVDDCGESLLIESKIEKMQSTTVQPIKNMLATKVDSDSMKEKPKQEENLPFKIIRPINSAPDNLDKPNGMKVENPIIEDPSLASLIHLPMNDEMLRSNNNNNNGNNAPQFIADNEKNDELLPELSLLKKRRRGKKKSKIGNKVKNKVKNIEITNNNDIMKTNNDMATTTKNIDLVNNTIPKNISDSLIELDEEDENNNKISHENMPYLRRTLRERKKTNFRLADKEDVGFTFVDYKVQKSPKYKVRISTKALLFLNLHAHLTKCEIIGLLGGRIENDNEIIIDIALPCKNISESTDFHSVEMDPASQWECQEKLEKLRLLNLGWYHSHPTFKVIPSRIDQDSHSAHQQFHQNVPYLGLIIGPYYYIKGMGSYRGDIFIFHVQKDVCHKLDYTMLPIQYLTRFDMKQLKNIIFEYKTYLKRIKIDEKWRKGMTYKDKIISALKEILYENLAEFLKKSLLNPIKDQKEPEINVKSYENSTHDNDIVALLDTEENIKQLLHIIKNDFN